MKRLVAGAAVAVIVIPTLLSGCVRKVEEDGKEWYGFFRKGARNHYHRISPKEAVLWKLKQASGKEAV